MICFCNTVSRYPIYRNDRSWPRLLINFIFMVLIPNAGFWMLAKKKMDIYSYIVLVLNVCIMLIVCVMAVHYYFLGKLYLLILSIIFLYSGLIKFDLYVFETHVHKAWYSLIFLLFFILNIYITRIFNLFVIAVGYLDFETTHPFDLVKATVVLFERFDGAGEFLVPIQTDIKFFLRIKILANYIQSVEQGILDGFSVRFTHRDPKPYTVKYEKEWRIDLCKARNNLSELFFTFAIMVLIPNVFFYIERSSVGIKDQTYIILVVDTLLMLWICYNFVNHNFLGKAYMVLLSLLFLYSSLWKWYFPMILMAILVLNYFVIRRYLWFSYVDAVFLPEKAELAIFEPCEDICQFTGMYIDDYLRWLIVGVKDNKAVSLVLATFNGFSIVHYENVNPKKTKVIKKDKDDFDSDL